MNNLKTIYLAGVPASGKSTIFRNIRKILFKNPSLVSDGLYRGISEGPFEMCGVFDGSEFEGTDRLAMNCIDDAIAHAKKLDSSGCRRVMFVEGDRLLARRFLQETGASLYLVRCSQSTLSERRSTRSRNGFGQSERFLKSRNSKINNILSEFGCTFVNNEKPYDVISAAKSLSTIATEWVNA